MRVRDTSGTYYWHIPTGTTQWEPPSPLGKVGSSMMSSSMSLETTPCEEPEVRFATLVWLRLRQKSQSSHTLIRFVPLSRNRGLNSQAPTKEQVKGNCGGWVSVKVIEATQVEDEYSASILVFEANVITDRVKTHWMYPFNICLLQCKDSLSYSIFHVFRRRLRLHLIKAWRSLKGQLFVMPPSTWSTICWSPLWVSFLTTFVCIIFTI